MALVSAIIADALTENGYLAPGESLDASVQQLALLRIQNMVDAWAADRLTLSLQLRTVFTLPSGTSTVQVGAGQTVPITRPMFINSVSYLIPSSSPPVEVPIGVMDEDAYANISIKALSSALPLQCFYQTNLSDAFGSLFFWPQVSQDVDIALYSPQQVGVPATVNSALIGPAGYQEAFMYQLALRMCRPLGIAIPQGLPEAAEQAFATMKRPNVSPGILSVDAALVPNNGAGYNVYSDVIQSTR